MGSSEQKASVGIAGIGIYIPANVETSADMAAKSDFPAYVFEKRIGIRQKPVAPPEEHPSDMGVQAALQALERAEVSPEAIDFIVYCSVGLYDYGLWSPSAKIQNAIGASRAFTYEIRNSCNGGNLGIYLASRHLLADADMEYALVVCSDTLSRLINYKDEQLLPMFLGGDGASAAVLRKGHPGNRVLSYAEISDGSLTDAIYVPLGGTRVPPTAENASAGLGYLRTVDTTQLAFVFANLYLKNYVTVVREALRKCGRSESDIDFLFTNQVKKKTQDDIFAELGVAPEKTCRTLEYYGHLAASDTLLALSQTLAADRIREGDLVVMASSGMGFHWGATVVQY